MNIFFEADSFNLLLIEKAYDFERLAFVIYWKY